MLANRVMIRCMASKRTKIESDGMPLTSNPFASLKLEEVPDGREVADAAAPVARQARVDTAALGERLVVRRQKRGQGGKTVTCVQGLHESVREGLLERVKRELGCSGRLEDTVLVAGTGDHRRVAAWLRTVGAANVTVGN